MRGDRDQGRPEPMLALDLRIDALERVEVGVDRCVRLRRFDQEEDDVGRLPLQLDDDRR